MEFRKGFCIVLCGFYYFSTEIMHLRSLVVHSVTKLAAKILTQLFGTFSLSNSVFLLLLSNHAFFSFSKQVSCFD